jgi:hypothetical protein
LRAVADRMLAVACAMLKTHTLFDPARQLRLISQLDHGLRPAHRNKVAREEPSPLRSEMASQEFWKGEF